MGILLCRYWEKKCFINVPQINGSFLSFLSIHSEYLFHSIKIKLEWDFI